MSRFFDLVNNSARPIRDFFVSLFDSRRRIANFANGNEWTASECARERRTNLRAITNHTNVEKITNAFLFGAFDDEVLQHPIDGIGYAVGFFLISFAPAKHVSHRP